jgi:hypothetical protein
MRQALCRSEISKGLTRVAGRCGWRNSSKEQKVKEWKKKRQRKTNCRKLKSRKTKTEACLHSTRVWIRILRIVLVGVLAKIMLTICGDGKF